MPETMEETTGTPKEIIAEINPGFPKDDTMTGVEIPMEDTILAVNAESEDHSELIEIEFPIVALTDNDDLPRFCPKTVAVTEPVIGNTTAKIEHTTGLSAENAFESRPTEAAEI